MIIPGARAQALAGAFTAVADDASAGWHNPAGLGYLKGPGVSVSVNNYTRSHKETSGVAANMDLAENSASIYPGFAGTHTNLGPLAIGWSYFTLEQQNTDESQTLNISNSGYLRGNGYPMTAESSFQYDRAELTTGNLIHAGASLSLALSRNISIGLSEFYYLRQKQTNLKERSTFDTGVFYDSFSRMSTRNEGTISVAGMLIRGGNLSLGLSVRIPRALSDNTNYETSTIIYTGSSPELSSDTVLTHREDELTMRTWDLGVAWAPIDGTLISADLTHYPATKTLWANSGGFDTRDVTDWSLGLEVRSSTLVLAGGAFTNSSLAQAPIPSLTIAPPGQINFVGFTTALGVRTRQSENLFIMVRQKGRGKTQMVQGDLRLQDLTIETQSFSLSSSYKF